MSVFDRHGIGRHRRRRWLTAGLAVVSATAAVIALSVVPALAVHDTGAFELDGNATNGAAPGDDWDNVCHQVTGSDCSTTSNTNGATAVDWVSEPNVNASIFTTGGSKDPQDINNWAWKDGAGGLPAKDNLLHSFAARYSLPSSATCPSGTASRCEVLYFGSDRLDNSGDAQQGFWFFQNKISLVGSGSGTFSGLHKNGDLLVVSDFSVGGTTSTITVFEWNTACTKTGDVVGGKTCGDANLLTLATSNNANCATAAAGDQFCGLVNANTITMPWSFTDKSGTPNNQALNGEFYEGGVNLSTLGLADRCFQSVASETRSSTSTTATLKDFILGGFGGCNTTVHTTPTDANGNPVPAGGFSIGTGSVTVADQATVTVSGISTWSGSVQFSLCGPPATDCTSGGTPIGSAVPIDNTTAQPISSPTATVTSVGTYCWRGDFTPSAASLAAGVQGGTDGSATECFTVNPVPTALGTSAGAGPVQLGNPISDTATLTGTAHEPGTPVINPTTPGGPAGGTITFTAFGPNNCSTAVFSTTVPVSGDGMYGPVSFTPTAVGTYHWAAIYSGDPPNTNGSSHNGNCSDTGEDVTVTTTTSAASQQNWLPNDTATVASVGGVPLNGTLSAQLYTGDNCGATSGSAVSGQLYSKQLTNAASPASLTTSNTSFTVTTSTSTSWLVTFTSTDANVGGSTHCESTSLTITN